MMILCWVSSFRFGSNLGPEHLINNTATVVNHVRQSGVSSIYTYLSTKTPYQHGTLISHHWSHHKAISGLSLQFKLDRLVHI